MIDFVDSNPELIELYSNKRFEELKGNLSDNDTRLTLADFLRYNLGLATELFTGIKLFPYQVYLLEQYFESSFIIWVASRGGSKCIEENSEVLTNRGILKIKDVKIGDYVFAQQGPQLILNKCCNPIENGFFVETRRGLNFSGKIGHKTLIFNQYNLTFQYVNIENLKVGDLLPIKSGCNFWGNNSILENFIYTSHIYSKEIFLKEDEELYYLLGLILGDGCIRSKRENLVAFTSSDDELLHFVKNKFREIMPHSKIRIGCKKNNKAKEIRIYNQNFVKFLKFIGFNTQHYAHTKTFPEKIKTVKKEYIAAFLKGLYDTDGYASICYNTKRNTKKITIGFSSSSKSLIKDVQNILLNFGIISSKKLTHKGQKDFVIMGKKCNTQNGYCVYFGNYKNTKKFYSEIGFKLNRKNKLIENYLLNKIKNNDYDSNLIKYVGVYLKRKYNTTYFDCGLNKKIKIHNHLSASRIKFFIEKAKELSVEDREKLNEIINNEYFIDEITKIETTRIKTVDITVDKEECYWSSGFIHHNSFLGALFSLLYLVFYNQKRIIFLSATFRSARRMLATAEKIINDKNASLLKQCFPYEVRRSTDLWELKTPGGGFIKALPLNEKIRGERADVIIIDEALLLTADQIQKWIQPFLTAKENIAETLAIKEQEDDLISKGLMQESDRISTLMQDEKKMIGLSSASYKFQYFYDWYIDWIKKATLKNTESKHFVARMSYLALPKELVEEKIIEEAKSGGDNTSYFKMEYLALFPETSENYFSLEHMIACTIPNGESPCIQVKGDKDCEYILSIDPSFSSGKDSDFFAMSLFLLNKETKNITLVNSYGIPGGNLSWHIDYLYYLITNFNIVLITADLLGGQGEARGFNFIQAANESARFKNAGIELKFFEGCLDDCGEDYAQEIRLMRKTYNKEARVICYTQGNKPAWKRRANEYMQHYIQSKKLFFASKATASDMEFDRLSKFTLPVSVYNNNKKEMTIAEFLEEQDDMIDETKAQISLIELKISANNNFTYDLPHSVKILKGESKARRDNYTTTLMGIWASKFYFDFLDEKIGKSQGWKPFFGN